MTLDGAVQPYTARCAVPMEAHEIDAHPDGPRIWATIQALRQEQADELDAQAIVDGLLDVEFKVTVDIPTDSIWLTPTYPEEVDQRFHDAIEHAVNETIPALRILTFGLDVIRRESLEG